MQIEKKGGGGGGEDGLQIAMKISNAQLSAF